MLKNIIAGLKSPSVEIREAAAKELNNLRKSSSATAADAEWLIESAAEEYPPGKYDWNDTPAEMMDAARDILRDKNPERVLPQLERVYPRLTEFARHAALRIVVLVPTPPAAELFVRLLERHPPSADSRRSIPEFETNNADVAAALFPRAIALVRDRTLAFPLLHMLLVLRNAGLVPPDIATDHHESLARVMEAEIQQARALQQPAGIGWRDDPPYDDHRMMAGLLMDLSGTLDSDHLHNAVERAAGLVDPRLRRFRAMGLLRAGRNVPADELAGIAQSPRDRYWLFDFLRSIGREDLLPPSCRDQSKLAEGNMVDWLCFGTELGREPNDIELIHVETRSRSSGPRLISRLKKRQLVDYYFFKYRVTEEHWSKKNGWMVGMAGGYARADQPTTSHDGGTFSQFEAFDSKPLAEHVKAYLD